MLQQLTGTRVLVLATLCVSIPAISPASESCPCPARSGRAATAHWRRANGVVAAHRVGSADRVITQERTVTEAVTLPAGTFIPIRLAQALDTKRDGAGTPFVGHVAAPVVRNGVVVLPRGALCRGHLVESKPSGRLKGRAVMSLSLDYIESGGRRYTVETTDRTFISKGHKGRNVAIIGGGTAGGAAIGAIADEGVGAAIGAGAGAAAGTVGALVTGRRNLHLAPETRLDFALRQPMRVRG